ncbi:MAG TPA: OB-fold domain-containing protein [Acidimicrobiales bacterium]|nr:OB-fold domain-containing protein [Acidimicrobiales bacterium]
MQRAIDESLFTWPADEPRLIGSKCDGCGTATFPRARSCPRCGAADMPTLELSPEGTLWTFTTQEFELKEPYRLAGQRQFETFGLGYVELPDNVKVETRLTESDPEKLEIGMDMKLVFIPAYTDPDGTEVMTFAFAPAQKV